MGANNVDEIDTKLRRRMLNGTFLKAMLEPIVPTTITAMTQERRQTKIWKEIYQNSLKLEKYKPSFFDNFLIKNWLGRCIMDENG